MLGDLVVAGSFSGLDKSVPPKVEVAMTVKVYVMPTKTLLPSGVTTWTPPKPHVPGTVVQHSTKFLDVNFPAGVNTILVALVDDEGTENAGATVTFTATALPDVGPSEATGLTAVFTPK